MKSLDYLLIFYNIAASMFLVASSAPSPQISVQASLDVVDPQVQVNLIFAIHARFYTKSNWIFQ